MSSAKNHKAGDRVRVKEFGAACAVVEAGDLGTIRAVEIDPDGYESYRVRMDVARCGVIDEWSFTDGDLEAATSNSPAIKKAVDEVIGKLSEMPKAEFDSWVNAVRAKVKLLSPDAKAPVYANPSDGAMDIVCTDDGENVLGEDGFFYRTYRTGLAFEIPEGYVGLLFPRSSISNTALSLANSVGVLDAHYRGEVTFRFRIDALPELIAKHSGKETKAVVYKKGDRIGQLMIIERPSIMLEVVAELSQTDRGSGGYGSTGQ